MSAIVNAVHDILVDCAKEGHLICSTDLAKRVGLSGSPANLLNALTPTLNEVFAICHKRRMSPLTALVYSPAKRHGSQIMAFWKLYKNGDYVLRGVPFREGVLERLRQEVFDHYQKETDMYASFETDSDDNDAIAFQLTAEMVVRLRKLHRMKDFSGLFVDEKLVIARYTCDDERLMNFINRVEAKHAYKYEQKFVRGIREVMSDLNLR